MRPREFGLCGVAAPGERPCSRLPGHPGDHEPERLECEGCGGSGLVGRGVTCPYCYGSGRAMYTVSKEKP